MGVTLNLKMVFIFPISCILVLIFLSFMIYFPNSAGKGSFPKSQIKSLYGQFPPLPTLSHPPHIRNIMPGCANLEILTEKKRVAQLVTCLAPLATDACLTADPGV